MTMTNNQFISSEYFDLTNAYIQKYSDQIRFEEDEDFKNLSQDLRGIFIVTKNLYQGVPYDTKAKSLLKDSLDPMKLMTFQKGQLYWDSPEYIFDGSKSITEYLDTKASNSEEPIISKDKLISLLNKGCNAYWKQSLPITNATLPKLYKHLKSIDITKASIAIGLPQVLPLSVFESAIMEKEEDGHLIILFNIQTLDELFMLEDSYDDYLDKYYQIDQYSSILNEADANAYRNKKLRISLNSIKNYQISLKLKLTATGFAIVNRCIIRTKKASNVEVFHKIGRKNEECDDLKFDWNYYYSLNAMEAQSYMLGYSAKKQLLQAHANGELHPFAYLKHPELDPNSKFRQIDSQYLRLADSIDFDNEFAKIILDSVIGVNEDNRTIISNNFTQLNKDFIASIDSFSRPSPISYESY